MVVTTEPVGDKFYETHKFPVIVAGEIVGVAGIIRDITDRKRAEEALFESEAKYRSVVERSLVGVYIIQDGLFRFVNRRWCEIYGYTSDEIIDKVSPLDLTPPEDRKLVEENFRKRLSGEVDHIEYEMRAIRKDGKIITMKVLGSFMVYKERPAVSGTAIDITESRWAEEQLRQKTALLEAQVNASLDGIMVVDKGRKILQNQQVNDLLKIPRHIAESDDDKARVEWIRGRTKDPEQFYDKVAYMLAHPGEIMRDDLELKDGTFLDTYSSPIIGKDGKHYGRIWTFRDITERKRSEDALRASRLQLSEAMDLAHIVYWELDPATHAYVFNDPFYAFYGTTAEQEGGYRMTRKEYSQRFIHPDDLPLYYQFVEQNISRPGPEFVAHLEHRIVRRDGEVRHILARVRIVKDDSGHVVKIYGANQDITERKRAEEALYESEQRYRAVFENTGAATVIIEKDTTISLCNAEFERLSGYARNEIEGKKSWTEFVAREDLDRMVAQHDMRRESRGQALQRYEFRFVPRTGEIRNIYLAIDIIHGTEKSVASLIDITEGKRTEEALRKSEERYRLIAENAWDVIWAANTNMDFTYISPSVERLQGWTAEELMALPLNEWMPARSLETMTRVISEAIAREERGEARPSLEPMVEIEAYRKDGTTIWAQVAARFVRDDQGRPKGIVGVSREITQRRRAEQALRESEGRLNKVVNAARDAIIMIDREGNISLWNEAATVIFGYSPEEMHGRNLHELLVPSRFIAMCEQGFSLFKSSGDGRVVGRVTEVTARRRDGKEIPVEVSVAPVRVGEEWHAVGVVRDITERKQTEQALRRSESTLKSVFSAAPVGIAITNKSRVPEWLNEAIISIMGYRTEELAKTGARLFYASDDEYARVGTAILDGIQRTGIGITDTKWVHKNGETRDVHLRGAAIDPKDVEAGFVFTAVDITRQKQSEQDLHESEAKYRMVVENSVVGFAIIQDNVMRFANERWCETFGYGYEEVIDRLSPLDVVHPDDRELVNDCIKKRVTGEVNSMEYEFRGIRKDGQTITVKVFGGAMVYRGRRAATSTTIDITREKTLESQLFQSQKIESIGMLAGGVAHDFNNILTTMAGYATLLEMKMSKEDPLQIYVGHVLSASRKAADLTRSLLAFSRQQPLSLKPVDLNDLLRGTAQLLRRLLTEDILLKTVLCGEDLIIMADSTQIDQILFNLTTNARDAMPGGGSLSLETRLVEPDSGSLRAYGINKPGRYALLKVSDTGAGMDANIRERVFEPFFTTKEVGKGTGLGLSTVYGIVAQHKGFITVSSELGMGTAFYIYLPMTEEAPPMEKPITEAVERGKETILLAEDGEDVRRLIKEVLVKYGYTVIEAADGEEAVRIFLKDSAKIDLLILDSVMPGKNGRVVYDEISRMKTHIKVLFMSGYTRDIVLDKGIEDKTFNFIAKPVMPAELLKKVRDVLDG
jgi:PAS domain S-box-containing protein